MELKIGSYVKISYGSFNACLGLTGIVVGIYAAHDELFPSVALPSIYVKLHSDNPGPIMFYPEELELVS